MDTDREFTDHGVLTLYASTDQTDIDVFVKVSLITDAPMTHFHGTKVGTDTYHHDRPHPSMLRLHEHPRT